MYLRILHETTANPITTTTPQTSPKPTDNENWFSGFKNKFLAGAGIAIIGDTRTYNDLVNKFCWKYPNSVGWFKWIFKNPLSSYLMMLILSAAVVYWYKYHKLRETQSTQIISSNAVPDNIKKLTESMLYETSYINNAYNTTKAAWNTPVINTAVKTGAIAIMGSTEIYNEMVDFFIKQHPVAGAWLGWILKNPATSYFLAKLIEFAITMFKPLISKKDIVYNNPNNNPVVNTAQ